MALGGDEVVRFLDATPGLKARAALTTAYAAGLRASEAPGIKVADFDSSRMIIRVERGKGGRDGYVMLSRQLPGILRCHRKLARPMRSLFPGRDGQCASSLDGSAHCSSPGCKRRLPMASYETSLDIGPRTATTDKGFDSRANRAAALADGVIPVIPCRENSKHTFADCFCLSQLPRTGRGPWR